MIFTWNAASLCENSTLLCTVYCVQVSTDVKTPVLGICFVFFFFTGMLGVFILICCSDLGEPLAKASSSPSDRNAVCTLVAHWGYFSTSTCVGYLIILLSNVILHLLH